MPIESPNLDDLRYSRILEELVRRIPVYAPEWTNHNDSDPGIALLQLFAYLAEQVGYRLNRVPDKAHVALLALLGIRLATARAATSQVAFLLASPRAHHGDLLPAGAEVTRRDDATVVYETDQNMDILPAQITAWIATKNPYLWDLLRLDETGRHEGKPEPFFLPPEVPTEDCDWMTLAWDGKRPKAKEMPLAPVPLLPASAMGIAHPWLWLGLSFNADRDAGFLGVEVTLHVVLDDDELPTASADITCVPLPAAAEIAPRPVDWLAYYDIDAETLRRVPGRVLDTTERLARSGTLRFTIPFSLGSPEHWVDLRKAEAPSPWDAGLVLMTALQQGMDATTGTIDVTQFQTIFSKAVSTAQAEEVAPEPAVGHPLDPELRNPAHINGWLRIGPLGADRGAQRVRHLGFNVVGITHASTVLNEVLGTADGRPGQTYRLTHRNVLAATLELEIAESAEPGALLTPWTEVPTLDIAGPFDRAFELDAEAGIVRFGDGERGAIPLLVPRAGQVVARRYRHGGGVAGECAAGAIDKLAVQATGLAGVVNPVPARGGADTETLDEAKERARKELSTRCRAVTADDFVWIASQTPTVRVARAIVVPHRRPLAVVCPTPTQTATAAPPPPAEPCAPPDGGLQQWSSRLIQLAASGSACGPALPAIAGLDDDFHAPGLVSLVVVPDLAGFEPLPTPSFLRAVCAWLDRHRLVTTEVHVAPPQYCRLCNLYVQVRGRPGWTRLQLQELVLARLSRWLDVLVGGPNGDGAPFGGQLDVADLIAQILRTEGVERVEAFTASFVRTKSNAVPRTGQLVRCPTAAGDVDRILLAAEETTSLEAATFTLATV